MTRARHPYRPVRSLLILAGIAMLGMLILAPSSSRSDGAISSVGETPGELQILGPDQKPAGFCPLQHTDVTASIAGFVARVLVRQTFHNPSTGKIEAVYIFPLPQDSAVDSMSMLVGDRKIVGTIKPRDEARQIYNTARQQGYTASLLDQERPNIFSQYVANIEPGNDVTVEISYTEMLKYDAGVYELVFPMVVGPRYNGGSARHEAGHRPIYAADHTEGNACRPRHRHLSCNRCQRPDFRHTEYELHAVDIHQTDPSHATVSLRNMNEIPHKDFILRYRTTTDNVSEAFLTHTDPTGTYFTLVLQPPHRTVAAQVVPKEMIFVIDQTGSQEGRPIEKAKECVRYCLKNLNPGDTFQVLAFNMSVYPCFPGPVPATADNAFKEHGFYINPLDGRAGQTFSRHAAPVFKIPNDPHRLRVISYMTDGYVGNDTNIIAFIKAHRGSATMFPFGTGNSVNRYLIEGMATRRG